jgi:ParB/RepB/Spo0J family partition protein
METEHLYWFRVVELELDSNVRQIADDDSLDGLGVTMSEDGMQNPIGVHRVGEKHLVYAGQRRFLAAKRIGMELILARVSERQLSPGEVVAKQLIENCQRRNLNPVDIAFGIKDLMERTDMEAGQAARKIGLSVSSVSKLLLLPSLEPEILEKVRSGRIPWSTAYEIAKEDNPALRAELAKQFENGKLTRDETTAVVQSGSIDPVLAMKMAVASAKAELGAGKGVSCVLPFLLDCRESTVVLDLGGGITRKTAAYREQVFGHRSVLLDPFHLVTKTTDTFNALETIDKDSETGLDMCFALAESLVIRTGQEKEPHWSDSAEEVIGTVTAAVVQYGDADDRSLQSVADMVSDPRKFDSVVRLTCESVAWDGLLARHGYQLTLFKDKELFSVMTTVNRHLRFLSTPAVAHSTRASSFDPSELPGGRMTVYMILPAEYARTLAEVAAFRLPAYFRCQNRQSHGAS